MILDGALAEWLRSGLQNRVHRFNSGRRLQLEIKIALSGYFSPYSAPPVPRFALGSRERGAFILEDGIGNRNPEITRNN